MSSRFKVGDIVDTPVFGKGEVVYVFDGEMCLKSEEEGIWTENVDDTSLTLVPPAIKENTYTQYTKEDDNNYALKDYAPTKEEAERVAKLNETEGSHYKLAIDPYEYSFKNNFNPLQFNAIKYLSRYNLKNGKQDLEKAINTINRLIELEYGE